MSINDHIRDNERAAAELARLTTLRDVSRALFLAGHYEAAKMVATMQSEAAGPVAKAADAYVEYAFGIGRWDDHVRAEKVAREAVAKVLEGGR